ncbi:MAG TPA: peptide chain release factor N(5)-glutamine methyltransferase [Patescibacteria group bacterium]|nr:peptide chain release factor N(5)-glutamine methyltransferase [Patescibacteria group bacterium]
MTIHDLIKVAEKKLKNSTSPVLDGEVLLSFVIRKPREYLLANPRRNVNPKFEKIYFRLINKRLLGWPVAYLTKHKEFFGLNFYVDKNVLIPRPETEGLVERVIDYVNNYVIKKQLNILDVGTGSGCIIISLAKNLGRKNHYLASDISPRAINIAKKNAKLHKTKVTFGDGNLLEPWLVRRNPRSIATTAVSRVSGGGGDMKFDIIVANLPYLKRESDPSTKFEPKGALIAAKKGTMLYEELFKQTSSLTSLPSSLFIEIGRDQGPIIKKVAKKYLPNYKPQIYKDLFGRTRYASMQKVN